MRDETHTVNAANNVKAIDQCQNGNTLLQHGRIRKHMEYLLESTHRYTSVVDVSGRFDR